jgi:small subunit ribosomal protein S16
MSVKIRLSRKGRTRAPFYHIVVADARAPRDGKFIEKIGTYNPMTKPATIDIDRDAAYNWLTKGAQPTDTVRAILRFKGVYYKKHLMRGLKKGALTQDQVDTMLTQWIDVKENKIASRVEQTKADLIAFRKAVSGDVKAVKAPVADLETKQAAEAFRENIEVAETEETLEEVAVPTVEEVVDVVENTIEEVTAPASEDVVSVVEEPEANTTETVLETEEEKGPEVVSEDSTDEEEKEA